MKLNATAIRALALPPGVRDKIFFDDDLPGFGLRLRAGGSRSWVVQYDIGAKTKRMALGSVTALDPGAARATAKNVLAAVRLGRDPAGEKSEGRAKAAETFAAVANQFLARQKTRLKPRSYTETERHMLAHSKPFHSLQIDKIDRRAIAARLTELASTSGPTAANRTRASLSAFFSWAMREGLIEANPAIATNKAHETGARDRVLSDDELRDIWMALEDDDYGAIVKLLLLTGQRRDEIGSIRWSEINLDQALITLPGERTKNKRPHEVPLSAPAITILKNRPRRALSDGEARDLIFGGRHGGFSGWSKAKAALDKRIAGLRKVAAKPPMEPWRLHDLRRTMSTVMHDKLAVAPHIVEATLNHASGHRSGVAGVYNRAAYSTEKRQALDRWASHVLSIAEGCAP